MNSPVDAKLSQEVAQFGARDMELCMQCATCSASCPLSSGAHTFPRKIYRYLQLGLKDKLLSSPEPWLCYYCGECNLDCPRGAEPAETMMATRRWLTTQYDWTGLARRFYLSEAWELGALGAVALGIVLLFAFFHGPVITDRVAVNTFAPVLWIEIGDLVMAAVLSAFLFSNAFRMFRFIMADTRVPLSLYISEAKAFVLHFLTQKRWRECGGDRSPWVKHFILVTGYLTMMTLVIVCIRWFQVDDDSWHFTSIFGYYATAVLLFVTVALFRSRLKKEEAVHRYSELSDWLFLVLLFFTTLTGILMHAVRIAGWPMGTYVMYVIHLAVAVPMLVIEVPFGKWSHLFYRPLAIFLSTVREKAAGASGIDVGKVAAKAGDIFRTCLQCGTCTGLCPWNRVAAFSPRQILRQLALDAGTENALDRAVWTCATCNTCGVYCPSGIGIVDLMQTVRGINLDQGKVPQHLETPLQSLKESGNPWNGSRGSRMDWAADLGIPGFSADTAYCLFTCCTTAYDARGASAGRALPVLLEKAGVSFGSFGTEENCCGDPAQKAGAGDIFSELSRKNTELFLNAGVEKILTTSPHCLNAFKKAYTGLNGAVATVHYSELLDRLVQKGRLKPVGPVPGTVTFHDPCYLGRYNGIYDAPRRILDSIPGLHRVEMADTRENSLCCGGGGGCGWGDPPPGLDLGRLRIGQALAAGAATIVTACPYCIRMLNEAAGQLGVEKEIRIRDLAELLLASVSMSVMDRAPMDTGFDQEVLHV